MKKIKAGVPTDDNPPHQARYSRGDNDWNLMTNACPVGSPKVNTQPGNADVVEGVQKIMRPSYDDLDGPNIYNSTTYGRR